MKSVEIVKGVYWVGAIDWNIRDYHGYTLPGTTYNAYLIVGDKIALIDNTYPGFEGQMLDRIKSVVDPKKIDYIIANHVEKDHSGGLPAMNRLLPGVPIYCTAAAQQGFAKHYDVKGWNFKTAKSGDTLSLGKGKTLAFLEAPMLHWPDSMFTYLAEEKILFPNDAFGQHIATSERFDDQLGKEESLKHAQKFFANLIIPLAPRVLKALAEGVMAEGVDVKVYPLKDGKADGTHRSNIVPDLLDSKALLVGTPTLQNQMYPTVADFMSYLKGLEPGKLAAKKIGFAFGSHGGHGGAIKLVTADLKAAGIEVISDGYEIYYKPDEAELKRFYELGQDVARRVKAL